MLIVILSSPETVPYSLRHVSKKEFAVGAIPGDIITLSVTGSIFGLTSG